MERITDWTYAEAIGRAMELVGPNIMRLLQHVQFLCGVSPAYAGLHHAGVVTSVYGSERVDYNTRAHVSWGDMCDDADRRTTVVLPSHCHARSDTIVHELAHCLDEVLGFTHTATPNCAYARLHRMEAFAMAFEARYFWICDMGDDYSAANDIAARDKATVALFDALEAA